MASVASMWILLDARSSHLCLLFLCSMTDIQDGSSLSVGDNVKCVIVPLVGSNRVSAVCLRKIK